MSTYTADRLLATIRRAKDEVIEDILAGHVPRDVKSFAELHDHVDANYYGGAFEESFDPLDQACSFWNAVQGAVDDWIKCGQCRIETMARTP